MTWDKKPSMKDSVTAFLVSVDGHLDVEASVSKYRSAVLQHSAKQESDTALISECMGELFDIYPGANLNLDFVRSQTVQRMAKKVPSLSDPTLFSILGAKVEDFLHSHCNQPEVAAKGEKPAVPAVTGQLYGVRKGLGGGFWRVADRVESV